MSHIVRANESCHTQVATHTVSAIGNSTLYPKNYFEILFAIFQLTIGMVWNCVCGYTVGMFSYVFAYKLYSYQNIHTCTRVYITHHALICFYFMIYGLPSVHC